MRTPEQEIAEAPRDPAVLLNTSTAQLMCIATALLLFGTDPSSPEYASLSKGFIGSAAASDPMQNIQRRVDMVHRALLEYDQDPAGYMARKKTAQTPAAQSADLATTPATDNQMSLPLQGNQNMNQPPIPGAGPQLPNMPGMGGTQFGMGGLPGGMPGGGMPGMGSLPTLPGQQPPQQMGAQLPPMPGGMPGAMPGLPGMGGLPNMSPQQQLPQTQQLPQMAPQQLPQMAQQPQNQQPAPQQPQQAQQPAGNQDLADVKNLLTVLVDKVSKIEQFLGSCATQKDVKAVEQLVLGSVKVSEVNGLLNLLTYELLQNFVRMQTTPAGGQTQWVTDADMMGAVKQGMTANRLPNLITAVSQKG